MSQLIVSCPMKGSAHWVTAFDNSQVAELQARMFEKVLSASALKREKKICEVLPISNNLSGKQSGPVLITPQSRLEWFL